jgi:hypothetical protein
VTKILIGSFPSGYDATAIPSGHMEALTAAADAKLAEEARQRQAVIANASRAERTKAAMRFRRVKRALKLLRGGFR